MATDVSICSRALVLLGDDPIASLSEQTKRASICSNLYPIAKRAILRMHVWNCAVKRVALAPLAGEPVGEEWSTWFAMPGDLLRVLGIGDLEHDEYTFEGGRILANVSAITLRYVADVTEGSFDALLTDLMTARMAADLAYPITKSASVAQVKQAEYRDTLRTAKAVDGQENPPEDFAASPFIQARSGHGAYGGYGY